MAKTSDLPLSSFARLMEKNKNFGTLTCAMKQLREEFFKRDAVLVAKELVGKILQVDDVRARILETEAYKDDKASHGRTRTKRSALMHDTYARVYVYFIYGMYHCLNITTDVGPGAVLIRSLDREGCDGPGKLCRELKIDLSDNGARLGKRFRIYDDGYSRDVLVTARIGITQDKHLQWRFIAKKTNSKDDKKIRKKK